MSEIDFQKAITEKFLKALDSTGPTETTETTEALYGLLDQAIREGMSTREACELFNETLEDIASLATALKV